MKIYSFDYQGNEEIKSLELSTSNIHDQNELIEAFSPESIVSESQAENDLVLELASRYKSGFCLYYPNFEEIKFSDLHKELPKVILLNSDDAFVSQIQEIGLIVFNTEDYAIESKKLCNYFFKFGFD